MKKYKKIFFIMFIFCLMSNVFVVNAEDTEDDEAHAEEERTTYNDGWVISVKWNYWQLPYEITATYTVTEDMINDDDTIDIDCSRLSKVLAYGRSSAGMAFALNTPVKLTIKNESGREIYFNDYDFSTIGYQLIGDSYQESDELSVDLLDSIGYGDMAKTYYTFLSEQDFDITKYESGYCPTVDTIGFDGNKIRMSFLPMRNKSGAMIALFNGDKEKLTVTNIEKIDSLVKEEINTTDYYGNTLSLPSDSTRTYGQFVKAYYGVDNLSDMTDEQLNDYFMAEDQIRGYDSVRFNGVGLGYKYIYPENLNDGVSDYYKKVGYVHTQLYNRKYTVYGEFFFIETDPELQQIAYEYVYRNVIRFTFDSTTNPVAYDTDYAGDVALMNYINKTEDTTAMVRNAFNADVPLEDGESIELANIDATQMNPDAFDQFNMFDFGFSLQYKAKKLPKLTIKVVDENTREPISEVEYKVQKWDETTSNWEDVDGYTNLITNEDGTVEVDKVPSGKYRVVQVDIPDDYIGIVEIQEVEITDEDQEVLFELRKKAEYDTPTIEKTGTEEITDKDELVNYEINYNTKIQTYKGDAVVTIVDTLPSDIIVEESNLDGGVYDASTRTITWIDEIKDIDTLINGEKEIAITKNLSLKYTSFDYETRKMVNNAAGNIYFKATDETEDVSTSIDTAVSVLGKVIVHYYIEGTTIKLTDDIIMTDLIDNPYITIQKEFDGYDFISATDNIYGRYTEDVIDVIYYYNKIEETVEESTEDEVVDTGDINVCVILTMSVLSVIGIVYVIKKHKVIESK